MHEYVWEGKRMCVFVCEWLCARTEIEPEVGHARGERAQLDDALAEEVVRLRAQRRLDLRAQVPVLVPTQYSYIQYRYLIKITVQVHTRTAPLCTVRVHREPEHPREARVCASQVRTFERVRLASVLLVRYAFGILELENAQWSDRELHHIGGSRHTHQTRSLMRSAAPVLWLHRGQSTVRERVRWFGLMRDADDRRDTYEITTPTGVSLLFNYAA